MIFRTYKPRPPLSEFVDSFWFWKTDDPSHAKARRLPTGCMEFVINLGEDPLRVYDARDIGDFQQFSGALICGAHSRSSISNSSQAAIGVHFKPGGAFPFLDSAASELRDLHVSLDAVWGRAAGQMRERLLEAQTPQAMFGILERALLTNAFRPLARRPAVAAALEGLASAPQKKVSEIGKQTGLSQRRFIQLFSEEVGLTPKIFSRIQRFQTALRLVGQAGAVNWADIASACGYFDQAHFIHDFQAFCGLNPSVYLAHRDEHINEAPVRD